MRKFVFLAAAICFAESPRFEITPSIQDALNQVSADSLRGNLSFLASDLLEGRDTPSRGLDIASEYIAAQFRKTGVEPAGDDGYFQTVHLVLQEPNSQASELKLGENSIQSTDMRVQSPGPIDIQPTPIFKLDTSNEEKTTAEDLQGKAVFAELNRRLFAKLRRAHPVLIIALVHDDLGPVRSQLVDPSDSRRPGTPFVRVSGAEAAKLYGELKSGLSDTAMASLHVPAPIRHQVTVRNVVAILRGSDPVLKDSCVMVSAHYDHIGMKDAGEGDRIYNGANDDGSGTVSVIELAKALSTLKERPKRSIVFVTFFGEEKGGFGSRYYARHPVIPLSNTVADINLEQVGRTDSSEGPQISNATLTGYDYSDLAGYIKAAGELTGIRIYKDDKNSDQYFAASDNISLAELGVPAHSLSVAYMYSDYHGLGDEWQKIDYSNMAKVDRMIAAALLMLADSPEAPHWNADNPKVEQYLKAWQKDHTR
jgi:hypothetical protein